MSEQETFVDPNSGAAPQPGSWAGAAAAEKGFGPPPVTVTGEGALAEEVVPSAYVYEPPAEVVEEPAEELAEEPVEVEEPEEEPEPEAEEEDAEEEPEEPVEESEEGLYDELLSGTVPGVLAYMEEHPEEKEAVQAAEAAGQNRVGIANA